MTGKWGRASLSPVYHPPAVLVYIRSSDDILAYQIVRRSDIILEKIRFNEY